MNSKLEPGAAGAAPHGDLDPSERERLTAREPGVLERFYNLYFDRVYAYVRRLLREEHLAEDLTQDIFMHIHRSLPSYDPGRELRPWVFTIATNKVRDHWRSRRHKDAQREVSVEPLQADGDGSSYAVSRGAGPRGELEREELSGLVADAIEELPEIMKTTLVLRYFEGLSFEAIGAMVDRNETAVRKRYSRALEELRNRLGPVLDEN